MIGASSDARYKQRITEHYDGFAGSLTRFTGIVTGHEALAGRLIRPGAFDVRGCKSILDAACGNGRYSVNLLKHADADAELTAFDLSQKMLVRARHRLSSPRVTFCAADLTRLPYAAASFDAVVCGWVIEHLADPRPALRELHRVMKPGAKLLLMATENTFLGRWCGRLWHCRTYNRGELRAACEECGLTWSRELWFTKMHEKMGLGGIVVELHRQPV
jgi:ubiquinone/menaquinone biosynthesis C-methylase UbiE